MSSFVCAGCGKNFTLAESVRARYPNWTPKQCGDCRGLAPRARRESLSKEETLARYKDGPQTGIFTDGHCEPNPGLGGWGAVKVRDGKIVEERHGQAENTTNNRMELTALIEGYEMLQPNEATSIYSDSALCVNTITKWAATWERKGWSKKGGEIKNLDLVMELYELAQAHPNAKLEWIRGHSGALWNEYADALSRTPKDEQHV
jgi:ribonuclease HI